jgi:hypothetical protein
MVTATSTDPTWTNERTKTYLEHSGIPYIDLLPTLRTIDPTGEVLYWHQDIHWTPAGNAVVGKVIQEYVEKNHLLQ